MIRLKTKRIQYNYSLIYTLMKVKQFYFSIHISHCFDIINAFKNGSFNNSLACGLLA